MTSPAVRLHDLTVAYERYPAIHHIKGDFIAGELTAVAGPNGGGKSTLLKAIAGILPIFEGSIEFCGVSRDDMAYLPQAADLQKDFPLNVLQMVTSGFWHTSNGFQTINAAQRKKAQEALAKVGLEGFDNRTLDSLSAGQLQRALFARLIVQDARLILLDEPFNAIDASTTHALLHIIQTWQAEKRTVICVLHDFNQIKEHFSDCLLIAREMVAWGKPREVLTAETLSNVCFFHGAHHREHRV